MPSLRLKFNPANKKIGCEGGIAKNEAREANKCQIPRGIIDYVKDLILRRGFHGKPD
jgi:hypothetical protein